ncbi:uncharacterized protein LOC121689484 isoform X1 [Alosa sapidissima]|uniref:uncharacterized protein LOC121689484 isoform X1 n=1 Tax=Alosa sapidissima TaxID=34773 RepID=UPI001C080EC9|nr:uncharacterized protein LOC121689484 isoform X1 [Alosa sapidissima]
MELQLTLMFFLMSTLLTAVWSLACCCCPADCRPTRDVDEMECFACVYAKIICHSMEEERIAYGCREEIPLCMRSLLPCKECDCPLWMAGRSPKKCKCGVLHLCCVSRIMELHCNTSLDLKKCLSRFGKVLPCILKCASEECCLSSEIGDHVDSKACLPWCICAQKHKPELGTICMDRFCCETVPPNRDIRTGQNLQALLAPLALVFLLS